MLVTTLTHQVLKALVRLLQGDREQALTLVAESLPRARAVSARAAQTRLELIGAIVDR